MMTGLPSTRQVVGWLPWVLATVNVLPEADGVASCMSSVITSCCDFPFFLISAVTDMVYLLSLWVVAGRAAVLPKV